MALVALHHVRFFFFFQHPGLPLEFGTYTATLLDPDGPDAWPSRAQTERHVQMAMAQRLMAKYTALTLDDIVAQLSVHYETPTRITRLLMAGRHARDWFAIPTGLICHCCYVRQPTRTVATCRAEPRHRTLCDVCERPDRCYDCQ